MYKLNYQDEVVMIALGICVIFMMIFFGFCFEFCFEFFVVEENLKSFYVFIEICCVILEIFLIIKVRDSIINKRWLAKNGKIVRNLPYEKKFLELISLIMLRLL